MQNRLSLSRFCCAIMLLATSSAFSQGVPIRKVAITGDAAPGLPSGAVFNASFGTGFSQPAIDNQGHVAFRGVIAGGGLPFQTPGIWSERTGSLDLVAAKGNAAPGTPSGVTFNNFETGVVINDSGDISFTGRLSGSGVNSSNDWGIWAQTSGVLTLRARSGSPAIAPGNSTMFDSPMGEALFNNESETYFGSFITGPSPGRAIFSEASGTRIMVARSGGPAPGLPNGYVFGPSVYSAVIGRNGVAFSAEATLAGSNTLSGVWSNRTGSLTLVAGEGISAPGTEPNVTFRDFTEQQQPGINGNDAIVFRGVLQGPGIDSDNNSGIWSDRSGTLEPIVRAGDQHAETGMTMGGFSPPVIAGDGSIGFSMGNSLWISDTQNDLHLIAKTFQVAPGTPNGVTFHSFFSASPYTIFGMNASQQMAFYARVSGPGINSANDEGIWATDLSGELRLAIREGDSIEVSPGVFKTVAEHSFTFPPFMFGGEDGRQRWFNDAGELAFRVWFTDNSQGLFVATIPEPSAMCLGLIAGAFCVFARRRLK